MTIGVVVQILQDDMPCRPRGNHADARVQGAYTAVGQHSEQGSHEHDW